MATDIKAKWMRVKSLLERVQASQMVVSRMAGVSQSAVSRILEKCPRREGAAFRRLCNYADNAPQANARDPSKNKELMSALVEVWNGTDEQADAIAAIIRAAGHVARTTR